MNFDKVRATALHSYRFEMLNANIKNAGEIFRIIPEFKSVAYYLPLCSGKFLYFISGHGFFANYYDRKLASSSFL